jgi:hypothetical protein
MARNLRNNGGNQSQNFIARMKVFTNIERPWIEQNSTKIEFPQKKLTDEQKKNFL